MKTNAPGSRFIPILVGIALVVSLAVATRALAAPADSRALVQQYAGWAGSPENAEALVTGLRSGDAITITTTAPDRTVSIAGFTPRAAMDAGQVASALSTARRSLARLGIQRPTAEQIQAALIGGEVVLSDGGSTVVPGAIRGGGSPPGRGSATR